MHYLTDMQHKTDIKIMKQTHTINYYNQNAAKFAAETAQVDFESTQKRFTDKLPENAAILDFGCGSGRDTKYFISQGYRVDATDGSAKLCELAGRYSGVKVKNMLFHELSEVERYDGIWACSSILHLPSDQLADVMRKMVTALKHNGVIYTSFKYGNFEGERNGRYFTDMTEETFADFLRQIKNVRVEEQWITSDVRPERSEEKWLNLILRKG